MGGPSSLCGTRLAALTGRAERMAQGPHRVCSSSAPAHRPRPPRPHSRPPLHLPQGTLSPPTSELTNLYVSCPPPFPASFTKSFQRAAPVLGEGRGAEDRAGDEAPETGVLGLAMRPPLSLGTGSSAVRRGCCNQPRLPRGTDRGTQGAGPEGALKTVKR